MSTEHPEFTDYAAAAPELERAANPKLHQFHPHDLLCVRCGVELSDETAKAECPEAVAFGTVTA